VSEISVSWIVVCRSAWRQRLHAAALGLSAGVVVAMLLVLATENGIVAAAGGALALLVGTAAGLRHRPPSGARWSVGPDGRVLVQWDGAAAAVEAAPAFVSTFLIVLAQRTRRLEVWRDAAPACAFRRLSAAVRWRAPRRVTLEGSVRPDGADRT
jgi:hypothetical protein